MKKLGTCLAAVSVALLLGACKQNQPAQTTATTTADSTITLTGTGVIADSTAERLVTNFNGRAYRVIKKMAPKPDSRSVWFKIGQLDSLVAKIKREGGDGIRFYFASYDKVKKKDLAKIDTNYLDYTTLVMVSTKADTVTIDKALTKIHRDYYKDTKLTNGQAKLLGAILMGVPENTGEICPPPSNCKTLGATLLTDK